MKLKYELAFVEIDGGPMAVPVGCGDEFRGVLQMNGTAADILELLKHDTTEDEIIKALGAEYAATEEEIKHNVQKVLDILREHQLLIDTDAEMN